MVRTTRLFVARSIALAALACLVLIGTPASAQTLRGNPPKKDTGKDAKDAVKNDGKSAGTTTTPAPKTGNGTNTTINTGTDKPNYNAIKGWAPKFTPNANTSNTPLPQWNNPTNNPWPNTNPWTNNNYNPTFPPYDNTWNRPNSNPNWNQNYPNYPNYPSYPSWNRYSYNDYSPWQDPGSNRYQAPFRSNYGLPLGSNGVNPYYPYGYGTSGIYSQPNMANWSYRVPAAGYGDGLGSWGNQLPPGLGYRGLGY